MKFVVSFVQRWLALGLVLFVAACGGGGGDTPRAPNSPTEGSPGFTLSRTSATLVMELGQSPLPTETLNLVIQSARVAEVAAGYIEGRSEATWLDVEVVSTGASTYDLVLRPASSNPAVGQYSTILSIGSFDANDDLMGYYDIAVTMTVSAATTVTGPALSFTVTQGAPAPAPLTLSLAMPASRTWQASDNAAWLQLTPASGTGSGNLSVALDASTLAPGSYSAEVSIVANGRTQTRPVTLLVRQPSIVAQPALLDVALLTGGSLPAAQGLQIAFSNGGAVNWTLVSKPDWVLLDKTSGRTPDVLNASVNLALTRPSTNTGEIVLSGASGSDLRIPVTATVTGPVLNLGASFVNFTGVNGSLLPPQTLNVALSDAGAATWTVSSSVNWLRASSTSGSTGTPVQLLVDAETPALPSGTYTTQLPISVSWSGRTLSTTVPVTLTLTRPALGVSSASFTLGGANGRDFVTGGALTVSLNTGARSFPVSLTGAPAWLAPSWATASVGSTPVALTLGLNEMAASPGVSTATVQVTAQVNGDTVTTPISVTFNRDTQRLVASDNGIALTRTPTWSRLTRTVQMRDTFFRPGVWNAVSDQPWLQVTASGSSRSGDLTVSANPSGLAVDQLHTATVTVTSNDGNRATEQIRVGLWVGSSTPSSTAAVTGRTWRQVAPDPVRPYAYAHDGGTAVYVYNVYTAALVATINNVGTALGSMAVASDGGTLYVADTTARRIVPVNLATRVVGGAFPDDTGSSLTNNNLAYGRVDGTGVLAWTWTNWLAVDGSTRLGAIPFVGSGVYSFSRDGRNLATINQGLSPATIQRYAVNYSTINGGRFAAVSTGAYTGYSPSVSNGADVALSADGNVVYSASGSPYNFPRYSGTPLAYLGAFAGDAYPVSVKVASDGRIFGAASVWYGPTDAWVYSPAGTLAASGYLSGYAQSILPRQFWPSGDAMMGIALTDDPAMRFMPVGP